MYAAETPCDTKKPDNYAASAGFTGWREYTETLESPT